MVQYQPSSSVVKVELKTKMDKIGPYEIIFIAKYRRLNIDDGINACQLNSYKKFVAFSDSYDQHD